VVPRFLPALPKKTPLLTSPTPYLAHPPRGGGTTSLLDSAAEARGAIRRWLRIIGLASRVIRDPARVTNRGGEIIREAGEIILPPERIIRGARGVIPSALRNTNRAGGSLREHKGATPRWGKNTLPARGVFRDAGGMTRSRGIVISEAAVVFRKHPLLTSQEAEGSDLRLPAILPDGEVLRGRGLGHGGAPITIQLSMNPGALPSRPAPRSIIVIIMTLW